MTDRPGDDAMSAVRPYVITGGRAGAGDASFSWESLVVALHRPDRPVPATVQPEHQDILAQCRGMLSVAELAAHLGQPPPVVQVLLADLLDWGLVVVRPPVPTAAHADADVLRKVLHGLESRL